MMHYRFECSLCGMSAHNSAANWLSWLHPITPTYTVSMIQGKWYYRAEVVLTEAETAPSTRPTFHLSPPFNLPKNTGRKQGRPDEIVCQRAEGIGNGFRARGGKEMGRESAKGGKARVLTFVHRHRKHAEWIWLVNQLASSVQGESDELLSSLFEIYRKDSGNSDSWLTSLTRILLLHRWLQKWGGEAEIWVWYRNHHSPSLVHIKVWNGNGESNALCFVLGGYVRLCLSYWPPSSLFFLQTLFHEKRRLCCHKCRQACVYSKWHAIYNISISRYFKCFWLLNVS